MLYSIGKPSRAAGPPPPPHPPTPLPPRQISLLRRNSAGAPSTKLLGVHFLKPSPMNQIAANIAELLLRKP
jgi:hypothetical protein